MANIGIPNLSVTFDGLGVSAVQRGARGIACIIIKDSTDVTFDFAEYTSVADLTSEEIAKYTETNLAYIKDCLLGIPSKVIVARMATDGTLADLLTLMANKTFDWIGIAEGETADHTALSAWVIASDKKIKVVCYNTVADNEKVVNFATTSVTYTDSRGTVTGDKYIARIVGMLAGMPLTMSAIAYKFSDLASVVVSDDLAADVDAGKFVLFNDDGVVRVIRAVNSLTTLGDGKTDDFKYIIIKETMDLIYKDIVKTWKNDYQGKYKNSADNQFLIVSAVSTYFKQLAIDGLLDESFANKCTIDTEAQRLANISKYGADVVASWSDAKVVEMTVGTQVYMSASIKILNAMEDFTFAVSL